MRIVLINFLFLYIIHIVSSEDVFCNINAKKSINKVSDKFLSLTIDPAVVLTGINLSDSSLLLAKNLAPSHIRIAGPSTQYVKFSEHDHFNLDKSHGNIFVTPSMWFAVNEWFNLANLVPIYGINDSETYENGTWRSADLLAILELADRFNISCFWEIGSDCSGKTEDQYLSEIKQLKDILNTFPNSKDIWQILAGDVSKCFEPNFVRNNELAEVANALMWENIPQNNQDFSILEPNNFLNTRNSKPEHNIQLWTTGGKSLRPVTFSTAIEWAKEIGEAARLGFKVIFRQPRLLELFSETPVYWLSYMHKKLMGTNVLDVKLSSNYPQTFVYANCAKNQNSFSKTGAMTILIINNNDFNLTTNVKVNLLAMEKTLEIQTYVLSSEDENSTTTFLNDQILTLETLLTNTVLKPKLRRTKTSNQIQLELPPKSIGFFVVTNARIPVCIEKEDAIEDILKEIDSAQVSREISFDVESRSRVDNTNLASIRARLLQELHSDEIFYTRKQNNLHKTPNQYNEKINNYKDLAKARKLLLERSKWTKNRQSKEDITTAKPAINLTKTELRSILRNRAKFLANKRRIRLTSEELDNIFLSANKRSKRYINTVLLDQRWKQERNDEMNIQNPDVLHHSNNLDPTDNTKFKRAIVSCENNPIKRIPRSLNNYLTNQRVKLAEMRSQIRERMRNRNLNHRYKRDINMDLLKRRSEAVKIASKSKLQPRKNVFKNLENKKATIRLPGETADEMYKSSSKEIFRNSKKWPSGEIYAELATGDSEDVDDEEQLESEEGFGIFGTRTPTQKKKVVTNPIFTPTKHNRERKVKKSKAVEQINSEDALQFLSPSVEFDDIEEDLPCIHEYFGGNLKNSHDTKKTSLLEMWENTNDKKRSKDIMRKNKAIFNDDDDYSESYNFDDYNIRKRRDTEQVTKADYLAYRKLMNEQLSLIRKQMLEDKRRNAEAKLKNRRELLGKQWNKKDKLEKNSKERKLTYRRDKLDKLWLNEKKVGNRFKNVNSTIGETNNATKSSTFDDKLRVKRNTRIKQHPLLTDSTEIDDILNEITKDSNIIKPQIDIHNGHYELILPNSDKVELKQNQGNTKFKFVHRNSIFNKKNNTIKQSDHHDNSRINNDTNSKVMGTKNDNVLTGVNVKSRSGKSNIQRIPSKDEQKLVENIVSKMTTVFQKLGETVATYFNHFFSQI